MTALSTATPDIILKLLRRLPPLERLRVVAEVLPELERELSALPQSQEFWRGASMQTLIEQQGIPPIRDFDSLLGGWPADEPVEDFVRAVRESRQPYITDIEAE